MRRLLHRPAAATSAVLLLALAGCGGGGSDSASDPSSESTDPSTASSSAPSSGAASTDGLSAVTITGEVGKGVTGAWHSMLSAPTSTSVTTLVKGTGAPVANGDTVQVFLWIGDGATRKVAYDDYSNGSPESIPNNGKLSDLFTKLLSGATYGSRVVAVTSAPELLGSSSGNPQLGISADDGLVVVADIVGKAAVSPTPSDDKVHDVAPGQQPTVTVKEGKPAALDFSGIAKPSLRTPVQRVVLTAGTGAAVKATDTLTVNYLGAVYQAKQPFDESFTKTPLVSPLSGLIKGWSIGLTGVKVGSRVLLQIPPAYGYGAQGSGSTIPGNATLWFVIDVVKAS